MEDVSSVDVILDFLQKNGFSGAETALRCELGSRPDKNGFQKLSLEDRERGKKAHEEFVKLYGGNEESSSWRSGGSFGELIGKDIECGTNKNGKETKRKGTTTSTEDKTPVASVGGTDKGFTFLRSSNNVVPNYTRKPNQDNSSGNTCQSKCSNPDLLEEFQKTIPVQHCVSDGSKEGKIDVQPENEISFPLEKQPSQVSTSGKLIANKSADIGRGSVLNDVDLRKRGGDVQSKEKVEDELWSRSEEGPNSSSGQWKECTVKSVLSFSSMDIPTTSDRTTIDSSVGFGHKEGLRETDMGGIRAAVKEQVDEVGRSLYPSKLEGICDKKNIEDLGLPLVFESQKEDFPRLPPVRLKSEEKPLCTTWEERFDHDGPSLKLGSGDNSYLIGSYLDVPVGQEINSSGMV